MFFTGKTLKSYYLEKAREMNSSQKRPCVAHGGNVRKVPVYCNKYRYPAIPEHAQVKLHLQHLIVYTMPLESYQCHVVLKEKEYEKQSQSQRSFGPFSIKHDKIIEEVYSCSISADKKSILLSVSLSSKSSHMISSKSHDFCMAIFNAHSNIGIQRTMLDPGTFSVGTFHACKNDAFFVVSYDSESLPVIQSKSLSDRSLTEEYLDVVDPDCENLLTISSCSDFLILQVIEADITPPYYNLSMYLLSPETLKIVKKITTPTNVAPCHVACTMNYLPDFHFEEGYIKGTFPKSVETSLQRLKSCDSNAMPSVKLPTVRVEPLKSLARNTIRSHLNCNRCINELQLPDIVQSYLM